MQPILCFFKHKIYARWECPYRSHDISLFTIETIESVNGINI